MRVKNREKLLRVRHICVAAVLAAFLCILALGLAVRIWSAWQELTVARMERLIDRCIQRYPQWEVEMDASIVAASTDYDGRIYAAFTNEEDNSLWGTVFVHHVLWGWEVSELHTGVKLPLGEFTDFDAGRTIIIGTGADCEPVARWTLCRMDDGKEVYRSAALSQAFVHVEADANLHLCAYDAMGNELKNGYDVIRMNHGYHAKIHETL